MSSVDWKYKLETEIKTEMEEIELIKPKSVIQRKTN